MVIGVCPTPTPEVPVSLSHPLQSVSIHDRRLQATLLVAAVGAVGRFVGPSIDVAIYAGALAGLLNAPRTGEWEYAARFAGLPAAYGGVVLTCLIVASVPLGFYSFPVDAFWMRVFNSIGPVFEAPFFVTNYALEAMVTFTLLNHLPGVPGPEP